MRAHRAYRQLALLLTRKGFHVLRFDYVGTGDSSGDLDDVTATDWMVNVGQAIDELKDLAGLSSVDLVGLRLGALIAAGAAAERDDVDRLILWDPVLSGLAYESELLGEIAAERDENHEGSSGNEEPADGALHFNGFGISRQLRDTLRGLDLLTMRLTGIPKILEVVAHETDGFHELRGRWQNQAGFRYQYTPAPHDWNYVDNFGGILLPQPVIQAIVNWVGNE